MPTVQEVLNNKRTHGVVTAAPETSVATAARMMVDNKIGSVLVVDGETIRGIFTERDLLNRVVAAEKDAHLTRLREVMTQTVACATPETKLSECRAVMTRDRVRHLPVIEQGRLVGMISIGDILAREVVDQQETIHYLHEYMYGRV
ncbi:MAG: CBS domain-containing protein [Phycisphaerae bacterium]